MDVVRIHRLELDCIVGIRPQEREHQQRVRLDIGLHADLSQAGRTGRISLTADYDQVAHEVAALLAFRHYHLVEMAAEEVSAMLLGVHAGVQRVDLRIEKPGALEGRARAASVEVRRTRLHYPSSPEETAFGSLTVLLETREARLELLSVAPGSSPSEGPGYPARSLQWVVHGELQQLQPSDTAAPQPAESGRCSGEQAGHGDGRLGPSLPGGVIHASSEAPSRLRNLGLEAAALFRCWKRNP